MKKVYEYNTFKVMFLIVIGKLFGLIRDSLIARDFGLSLQNDTYIFVLGITMLLISVSYGITNAFIPLFGSMIKSNTKEDNNNFVNNLICIVFIITVFVIITIEVFAKVIVIISLPNLPLDGNLFQEAIYLIRIMSLSIIFMQIQGVLSGVLQSHNEFMEISSAPIISNFVTIIYLLFLNSFYGVVGLGVFTTIGFLAMLFLLLPKFLKLGYKFYFILDIHDKRIRLMFKNLIPIIISTSLITINLFILKVFAGRLGNGAISSLDYVNKVGVLIYEVVTQAIITIIYPKFTKLTTSNGYECFNSEVIRGTKLILLLTIPSVLTLFLLRREIISIYLMRGKFGFSEVIEISSILIFYLPTIIFYSIREIITKALFAINKSREAMKNSFLCIIINILLSAVLINLLDIRGLALANSTSMFLSTIIMYYRLKKETNIRSGKTILLSTMYILFAAIITMCIVLCVKVLISSYIWRLFISCIISFPIYFYIIKTLKIEESNFIFRR
jgi:putative peptidoglycan lipid II flippase